MKPFALVLVAVTLAAVPMCAEDATKGAEMTGWLCNSKCVARTATQAACDQNCVDKTGDAVVVDDRGQVLKIANPENAVRSCGKTKKQKSKPAKTSDDTPDDSLYQG